MVFVGEGVVMFGLALVEHQYHMSQAFHVSNTHNINLLVHCGNKCVHLPLWPP